MATEFGMLQIMNAALVSQGQYEIVAENEGTDEWRLLSRNWPLIVEPELEASNYHFTKAQTELLSRSAGKYGYDDAYMVPAAALFVRNLWIENVQGDRIVVDWVQDGSYVYLNNDDGCFIEYLVAADVSSWSANFARGIQLKLEALIARAIKEEYGDADRLEALAEQRLQMARTTSSKARRPQKPYKAGPIASSRFRSGAFNGSA